MPVETWQLAHLLHLEGESQISVHAVHGGAAPVPAGRRREALLLLGGSSPLGRSCQLGPRLRFLRLKRREVGLHNGHCLLLLVASRSVCQLAEELEWFLCMQLVMAQHLQTAIIIGITVFGIPCPVSWLSSSGEANQLMMTHFI